MRAIEREYPHTQTQTANVGIPPTVAAVVPIALRAPLPIPIHPLFETKPAIRLTTYPELSAQ